MDWTNFQDVLLWLTGVGAPALVMYAVSYLAENWTGWTNLSTTVKTIIPMVLSLLVALGASLLLKYPEIIATVQPWFQIIASAIIAYIASQKAYMTTKVNEYGVRYG